MIIFLCIFIGFNIIVISNIIFVYLYNRDNFDWEIVMICLFGPFAHLIFGGISIKMLIIAYKYNKIQKKFISPHRMSFKDLFCNGSEDEWEKLLEREDNFKKTKDGMIELRKRKLERLAL